MMATSSSTNLKWGILGTGHIAQKFARDLLVDPPRPKTNGDHVYTHSLVGVASSTSIETARSFLARVEASLTCVAYNSYDALLASEDVEIVYIATPHSHHFQNAMSALVAGKHVLCEKPIALNAAQTKALYEAAIANNRFLMENLWTRLLPAGIKVQEIIRNGAIGTITRVWADNSLGMDMARNIRPTDRIVTHELGGGALMDLAVCSLHWVFQALPPRAPTRYPVSIFSTGSFYPFFRVEETVTILMTLPPEAGIGDPAIQAIASASLRVAGDPDGHTPAVRIQGDKGEIQLFGFPWCPSRLHVIERTPGFQSVGTDYEVDISYPAEICGLRLGADEAAMCIRHDRIQSLLVTWDDTMVRMKVLDEVRKQLGIAFPIEFETAVHPVRLPTKADR